MQKVYLLSEFGTLFDPRTGEFTPVETAGRITALCTLRPEDVMGDYGYLAIVEQPGGEPDAVKAVDEERKIEPVDPPFVRQAIGLAPVMIVNHRNWRVVN
jgi:hypothetical protein